MPFSLLENGCHYLFKYDVCPFLSPISETPVTHLLDSSVCVSFTLSILFTIFALCDSAWVFSIYLPYSYEFFCQIQSSVKPTLDFLIFFTFHFYRFYFISLYGFWFSGEILHIVIYFLDYINHNYV